MTGMIEGSQEFNEGLVQRLHQVRVIIHLNKSHTSKQIKISTQS